MSPPGTGRTSGAVAFAAVAAASLVLACGGKEDGRTEDAATTDSGPAPATATYFVRLRRSADPRAVADRHGVEPTSIVEEEGATAFVAALTEAQVDSLRADSLVVSLAREIHRGGDSARPRPRGVPPSPTDTGGARP